MTHGHLTYDPVFQRSTPTVGKSGHLCPCVLSEQALESKLGLQVPSEQQAMVFWKVGRVFWALYLAAWAKLLRGRKRAERSMKEASREEQDAERAEVVQGQESCSSVGECKQKGLRGVVRWTNPKVQQLAGLAVGKGRRSTTPTKSRTNLRGSTGFCRDPPCDQLDGSVKSTHKWHIRAHASSVSLGTLSCKIIQEGTTVESMMINSQNNK